MRKSFLVLMLGVLALANSGRADELFSSNSLSAPFAGAKASGSDRASAAANDRGVRVLNLDQLAEILTDAGLAPKRETDSVVAIKFQHARWTFPVAFTMTDDSNNIWMTVLLAKLEKDQKLTTEQLLGLLGTNRDIRPAFFTLSDSGKRVEMFLQLHNQAITPKTLRDSLATLVGVAENTGSLWDISAAGGTTPARGQTAQPQANPATVNPSPNGQNQAGSNIGGSGANNRLLGKWLATISEKEALAAQLNADQTYTLVHVKNGKQTKSNGKFSFTGAALTFTARDGDKIAGNIAAITENSFDYSTASGNKIAFKRAK